MESRPALPDVATIAAWLKILVGDDPSAVFEIRALNCITADYRRPHTRSGFFDASHLAEAAAAIMHLTTACKASGVYWTLNPVNPALLARRANRVDVQRQGEGASDADIVSLRWMLLDFDPVRPGGISSTKEEREHARLVAVAVAKYLAGLGWPDPCLCDSGNGWHLLYRLPPGLGGSDIIRRCLHALGDRFHTPEVDIDRSVFNPSRICKAYGSWSRKGDRTKGRPHRISRLVRIPDRIEAVPEDLLRILASEAPEPKISKPNRSGRSPPTIAARVAKYIAACRPSVSGEHGHDNAYRIACELVRGFSLTVDDALPFFSEWNQRCEPPWSDRDLLRKLEEADKSADGEPGYLLRGGHAGQQQSGNAERPLTDGVTFDLSGFGGESKAQEIQEPQDVDRWDNRQVGRKWHYTIDRV